MLVTRYTYAYRAAAVAGFVLAAAAIFLPWITLNSGTIGELASGQSATGWELLQLPTNGPVEENLFAYLFIGLWVILFVAGLGAILAAAGRDPRGAGGYLAMLTITYLVLIMFLLPTIQEQIPLPPDACPDSVKQQLEDALQSGDSTLAAQLQAQCDSFNAGRDRVLAVKDAQILPTFGMFLTVVGGILAFVGGRLVGQDSEKLGRMRIYHTLLVEAHKDGRITQEEEDLLALQRKLYSINREEHELVLKHMFPQSEAFEDAVYMHQNPIDVDRLLLDKHLQDYETFVQQAYRKGAPTEEEREMLAVIRRQLNISGRDHEMVLGYLQQEGRIPPPPRSDMHGGLGGRPSSSPGPAAAAARREPAPVAATARPAPAKSAPPKAAPAAAAAPPAAKKAPPAKPRKLKCPKCSHTIVVKTDARPTKVVCENCGHVGTLRK